METDLVNCFVCYASCVAKEKYLGSHIARLLTMPLSSLLSKCLQSIVQPDDEFFCGECSRKLEEYDQLVQLSLQIETELYEQFQNKVLKVGEWNTTDNDVVVQESMNEVLVDFDPEDEKYGIDSHLDIEDSKLETKQIINGAIDSNEHSNIKWSRGCKETKPKSKPNEKIKKRKTKSAGGTKPKPHYTIEQVFCDICGRSYMSKGALSVHLVKHLQKSPHECKICKKTFTQRIGLARHIPIHTGEKKHQCDVCGKQFIHSASFNMHKKIHVNHRPKKCTICDSEFRSTSHIARHMRTHTGEKPFACPICGQKFAQRYNMNTHYKTHQKETKTTSKQHKCLICPETFLRREKLNEHLSHVHQAAFGSSVSPSSLVDAAEVAK